MALESSFEQQVKPFLKQNCVQCHNADVMTSGVRVDQLDAALEDRHLRLWEAIRKKIGDETMPPKGLPQPTSAERQQMVEWITHALEVARSRPTPKNGLVRRLTVSQYRNTLRELLLLDDDLTETLPPDAVSRDGFVNNTETLQLSPLLMEAYFEIAEEALNRSIVDPKTKPAIQNFRVDLGASINPEPLRRRTHPRSGQSAAEQQRLRGDATDAQQTVRLRTTLHADQVSFHRRLCGERYGPRLERVRQYLSRGLCLHARQPRLSQGERLQHGSAGAAAAAGHSER